MQLTNSNIEVIIYLFEKNVYHLIARLCYIFIAAYFTFFAEKKKFFSAFELAETGFSF